MLYMFGFTFLPVYFIIVILKNPIYLSILSIFCPKSTRETGPNPRDLAPKQNAWSSMVPHLLPEKKTQT